MFARLAILALLAASALCPVAFGQARAQDSDSARHWPLAKISFPVDLERVQAANPRPVALRFYARPAGPTGLAARGKFDLVAEKKPDELDDIEDLNSRVKKRGFNYTSGSDGRVDFALQYVFANGEAAPATANLTAQYRIVFDTRQPLARIAATGPRSVKWSVDDENLVSSSIRLEVRSAGGTAWTTVTTREFGANDAYTWAPFDRNRVLEVRVLGKDRAGHEGVSNIVRISGGDGAVPQTDPPPLPGGPRPGTGPGGGRIDTGFGGPDDFPNRPQIDYVNDTKLIVRSKPTRITRSGIPKAVLWMKEQTGQWQAVKTNDAVNITLDDAGKEIAIPYEAKGDGLYQFVIQPINGAGQKPADPRDGDPAHWIVEVDTTPPKVTLKGAKAVPGGLNGPRVEIDYAIVEKNPLPDPITIEYTTDPQQKNWTPIASKVPNTGKYVWEIEDRNVWKFHLRVTAQDRAGNSGSDLSKDMITVDLDTPGAVIERIDKAGGGGPRKNNWRDDEEPKTIPPTGSLPMPPKQPDPPVAKPEVKQPDPLPLPPKPTPQPPKQPDPKTEPKKGNNPKPEDKKTKTSAEVPETLPIPSGSPAVPPTVPELPTIPGGVPGGVPALPPPAGGPDVVPPPVALPPLPGEMK